MYQGPIYSVEDVGSLCPWCLADGSAAASLDAMFTDDHPLAALAPSIIDEVVHRTPGFFGWQQERWLIHCGDAAAFLGRAGYRELVQHPAALERIREELDTFSWPEVLVNEHLEGLDSESSPTAYLFRCLHCGEELAYSDTD